MHSCAASDPRDLVYACLGICSHKYGIHPNYDPTFSVEDLLHRVAQNFISHTGDLSILRTAYLTRWRSGSNFPSWIPDWRNMPSVGQYDKPNHQQSMKCFTKLFSFHPDSQGRPFQVLQVRGLYVGVISKGLYLWSTTASYPSRYVEQVGGTRSLDEVYLIHGFSGLLVLRRRGKQFIVVGEVLERGGVFPQLMTLVNDLEHMVETNDLAVQTISLY